MILIHVRDSDSDSGDTMLKYTNGKGSGANVVITAEERRETMKKYLKSLPAYFFKENLHQNVSSDSPPINTTHCSFVDPAKALVDFFVLQANSRLSEGHFKGHATEMLTEGDLHYIEHIIRAMVFFFDGLPIGGFKNTESILLISAQFCRWRRFVAGNPLTMLPLLLSAGNDSTEDNERLVEAEFEKIEAGLKAHTNVQFRDRFTRLNVARFDKTRLIV